MNECMHEYKPRYTRKWSTVYEECRKAGIKAKASGTSTCEDMLQPYLKEEVYIYDICLHCGDTKRPKDEAKE